MALLLAGLPEKVPGTTINRLCASGLDAVGSAARAIRSGEIDPVKVIEVDEEAETVRNVTDEIVSEALDARAA